MYIFYSAQMQQRRQVFQRLAATVCQRAGLAFEAFPALFGNGNLLRAGPHFQNRNPVSTVTKTIPLIGRAGRSGPSGLIIRRDLVAIRNQKKLEFRQSVYMRRNPYMRRTHLKPNYGSNSHRNLGGPFFFAVL